MQDKTKVYGSEDETGKMEHTCMTGFGQNRHSMDGDLVRSTGDKTKIFGGDTTAQMEITCMGANVLQDQIQNVAEKSVRKDIDKTKVFAGDETTADMEQTCAVETKSIPHFNF